ncbi:MAG: PQQ-binding-like beta-propeller repeat protein [Candidatus Aenigmarchaeota archaeon]|nr:PQQ-binding-like beta-propeller repeat protein [Candidatus Aenigmarchaeota archaeon]
MQTGIGFGDFEIELEDIRITKTMTFVRGFEPTAGGSIASSPKIWNNMIHFGSLDTNCYALTSHGEEIWRTKLGGMITWANPIFWKDFVMYGTYDHKFYALDSKTGKIAWNFQTGGKIVTQCNVSGNNVYVVSSDGYIYSLNASDGKELWRFRTGDKIATPPTVAEDRIYFGSFDHNMYCLSLEGKEIWRFKTGDEILADNPYKVYDGILYFASLDCYVYAVDAKTGRLEWKFKTGKYGNTCAPIRHEDRIYHACRDGIVYCLTKDGKEVWRFLADGLVVQVGIFNDRLFFGDESGNLYCLSLDGKEIWRFKSSGAVYTDPLFHDNMIYIGSMDCHLYCLNLEGKELWRFQTSSTTMSYIGEPYGMYEAVVRQEATKDEETKEEERYSVNFSEDFSNESEYSVKSEYVIKSEYA